MYDRSEHSEKDRLGHRFSHIESEAAISKDVTKAISVVILSGGQSSRMGRDKAMLQIEGMSFAEYIASSLKEADEILFSVRQEKDLPEIPLTHIADIYPGCGPLAGIHSGLKHSRNPWVFIVACDTPFVNWGMVEKMYAHAISDDGSCSADGDSGAGGIRRDMVTTAGGSEGIPADAVIPVEDDGRFHAVCGLYHKNALNVLQEELEEGHYRVRDTLSRLRTIYIPVTAFPDYRRLFYNINTPDDYQKVNE